MGSPTIRVSKLDAAQRQLRTAIALWFEDGDPVSVHALAFAAYEVFHSVSKHRDPSRRDLLFDSAYVKDGYRKEYLALVKKEAHFFKHADRDPEAILDFCPDVADYFILYAILAHQLCGESQSEEESIFMWWIMFHRTEMLSEEGRKGLANRLPIEHVERIKHLSKSKFFEACRKAGIGMKRPLVEMS
jgi:hypothetical protein